MAEAMMAILEEVGERVRLAEAAVHAPSPGHALVRMVAARVGDADRAAFAGAFAGRLPLVLGAEGAGIVEAVGEDAGTLEVGNHVLVVDERAHLPGRRGVGASFRPLGTFATHASVPVRRLVRVHPSLSLHRLAEAGEAILAGYDAGRRALEAAGQGALLVVGLGEAGQGALTAALAGGGGRVIAVDRRPARLAWAESLGAIALAADRSDLGRAVRSASGGHGVDAVVLSGDSGGRPVRIGSMVRVGARVIHPGHLGCGPEAETATVVAERFGRDRAATLALLGADGDLGDLGEILADGARADAPAALLELGFDLP